MKAADNAMEQFDFHLSIALKRLRAIIGEDTNHLAAIEAAKSEMRDFVEEVQMRALPKPEIEISNTSTLGPKVYRVIVRADPDHWSYDLLLKRYPVPHAVANIRMT